ncbi:DUF2834 domain-containing protein [Leifsonia poae]|uniref:DUF2834 domain-containing protein n=1 Tax=Leifsonia poae TaxID=110933 RepID=UPI003D677845
MTRTWNARAIIYLVLAILGLIGTWSFNIVAITAHRDFFGDWFGSGPAVTSLGIDLLVVAVAAIVFMVTESRRLRMRGLWLYLILIPVVALAFSLPLFLCARERRILARASASADQG